jgi:hypothetical protein
MGDCFGKPVTEGRFVLKVYYRFYNSLRLFPILRKMNLNHTVLLNFFKILLNIILPSTHRLSEWSLSSGFLTKILCEFLFSPIRVIIPRL